LHETLVTKSGFFVMEMSKNSPTSICSSQKFFRLASARHIMEDKGGEGRDGRGEGKGRGKGEGKGGGRRVSPQTQKPNSAYVVTIYRDVLNSYPMVIKA
jgi:hypothetical protein